MKVINLSVPEETWRLARIEAAKHNTTLSGLVRGYLQALVKGKAPLLTDDDPEDTDRQTRNALAAALQGSNLVLGYQPSRDRTYER